MVDQLSLQAGRVTVFQDVDDTTAFTVEVTNGGSPVDLSGSTWADPDGLMTVDTTDAASGKLGLSCGVQTGNQDWRLQADGDTTYLQGTLVVGSTRHVGAGGGTISVAVEDQAVTVSAVVPTHDHNGAYAPVGHDHIGGYAVGDYVQIPQQGTATTRAIADGRLFIQRVYIPAAIDRLAVNVSAAGTGGTLRLGAYSVSSGRPSADPLVDAGTIDLTSATAQEVVAAIAGNQWIYLAALGENVTGSPSVTAVQGAGPHEVSQLSLVGSEIAAWFVDSVAAGALPTSPTLAAGKMVTTAPKWAGRVA